MFLPSTMVKEFGVELYWYIRTWSRQSECTWSKYPHILQIVCKSSLCILQNCQFLLEGAPECASYCLSAPYIPQGDQKALQSGGAWSLKSGINSRDNSEAYYYMIMEGLEIFTLLYVYDCYLNGK